MNDDKRVVALIDMDCFYVQVEEREQPENKGKPGCVVQYKNWKGGGIIAVNYEARATGITRQMRGDEARERCSDCILYRVPEQRGKADLTKYRDAGKEVIDVLWSFGVCIERASIDEAYLDMTEVVNKMLADGTPVKEEELPNTYIVGSPPAQPEGDEKGITSWLQSLTEDEYNERNWKLGLAAVLCERMRAAVYEKTGFRCSAGIAVNKMLAKLACGINKPNKQTVLPMEAVPEFFMTFPLKKVRNLGGKLGLTLREELNCTTMNDVAVLPERVLEQHFDKKTATWLHWYAKGVDNEPVNSRRLPKSIGCNKNFTGVAALDTRDKILHWLEELCSEVVERLDKDKETNQRTAKLLSLTVRLEGDIRPYSYTRSLPLTPSYNKSQMARDCLTIMSKENPSKQSNIWNPVVTCIGVSASKFVEMGAGGASNSKIDRFFTKKRPETLEVEESDSDKDQLISPLDETEDRTIPVQDESTQEEVVPPEKEEPKIGVAPKKTGFFARRAIPVQDESTQEEVVPPEKEEPKVEEASKKTGFFARRAIQNKQKEPELTASKDEEPSTSVAQESSSFSVKELFPDLEKVDQETLGLLPIHLQREVRRAIENHRVVQETDSESSQSCSWSICGTCGKKLMEEELEEHKDYHMALELQKEFSALPTSVGAAPKLTSGAASSVKSKSIKRPLKDSKKKASDKDSKKIRTIETFFRNTQ